MEGVDLRIVPFVQVDYGISGPGFDRRGYTETIFSTSGTLYMPEAHFNTGQIGSYFFTVTAHFDFYEIRSAPEPNTLVLLASGLFMLIGYRINGRVEERRRNGLIVKRSSSVTLQNDYNLHSKVLP